MVPWKLFLATTSEINTSENTIQFPVKGKIVQLDTYKYELVPSNFFITYDIRIIGNNDNLKITDISGANPQIFYCTHESDNGLEHNIFITLKQDQIVSLIIEADEENKYLIVTTPEQDIEFHRLEN